jgi:hypothetical protein
MDPSGNSAIGVFPSLGIPACFDLTFGKWTTQRPYPLPDGTTVGGGETEGYYLGVIWSEGGSCEGSPHAVHVALAFTSLDPNRGGCAPVFERELRKYDVVKFGFADAALKNGGCRVADGGTVHKRSGEGTDCSYVTWKWSCPVRCDGVSPPKYCVTPDISTEIYVEGDGTRFHYSMGVEHSVTYFNRCCKMFPCLASLQAWQIYG